MKSKKRLTLIVLSILGVFLAAIFLSGVTGIVVDAENGQPIEGAVVLLEWTTSKGLPGLMHTESERVIELVTDKEGHFRVAGVFPFIDTPHITVYKKSYVAWNNEYIFPDYRKREDFIWKSGCVFNLEKFKPIYTHNAHVAFITTFSRSTLAYEKKRKLINAYDWETDLALKEVKNTRK